jgi:hypothetical protein
MKKESPRSRGNGRIIVGEEIDSVGEFAVTDSQALRKFERTWVAMP